MVDRMHLHLNMSNDKEEAVERGDRGIRTT